MKIFGICTCDGSETCGIVIAESEGDVRKIIDEQLVNSGCGFDIFEIPFEVGYHQISY